MQRVPLADFEPVLKKRPEELLRMAREAGVQEAQVGALAGWRASGEFDAREMGVKLEEDCKEYAPKLP